MQTTRPTSWRRGSEMSAEHRITLPPPALSSVTEETLGSGDSDNGGRDYRREPSFPPDMTPEQRDHVIFKMVHRCTVAGLESFERMGLLIRDHGVLRSEFVIV